ncbi:hypothetical protein BV898_01738 [Hypsibius exemplaris]|uniref:Chitin-binding type-2 domain-containing protein n=1 Tax=Hypsibius exemplaris TaxID=2072580 RepID=A0A1W0XAY3_HYPEX|nr:hypothetical protein BV898_01738 [Hypsibius exemplaris]
MRNCTHKRSHIFSSRLLRYTQPAASSAQQQQELHVLDDHHTTHSSPAHCVVNPPDADVADCGATNRSVVPPPTPAATSPAVTLAGETAEPITTAGKTKRTRRRILVEIDQQPQCQAVDPINRVTCGRRGQSKSKCKKMGCCFDQKGTSSRCYYAINATIPSSTTRATIPSSTTRARRLKNPTRTKEESHGEFCGLFETTRDPALPGALCTSRTILFIALFCFAVGQSEELDGSDTDESSTSAGSPTILEERPCLDTLRHGYMERTESGGRSIGNNCPDLCIGPNGRAPNGNFSHPDDCRDYIQCDNWKAVAFRCNGSEYFDTELQSCTLAGPDAETRKAQCTRRPTSPWPPVTTPSASVTSDVTEGSTSVVVDTDGSESSPTDGSSLETGETGSDTPSTPTTNQLASPTTPGSVTAAKQQEAAQKSKKDPETKIEYSRYYIPGTLYRIPKRSPRDATSIT